MSSIELVQWEFQFSVMTADHLISQTVQNIWKWAMSWITWVTCQDKRSMQLMESWNIQLKLHSNSNQAGQFCPAWRQFSFKPSKWPWHSFANAALAVSQCALRLSFDLHSNFASQVGSKNTSITHPQNSKSRCKSRFKFKRNLKFKSKFKFSRLDI